MGGGRNVWKLSWKQCLPPESGWGMGDGVAVPRVVWGRNGEGGKGRGERRDGSDGDAECLLGDKLPGQLG